MRERKHISFAYDLYFVTDLWKYCEHEIIIGLCVLEVPTNNRKYLDYTDKASFLLDLVSIATWAVMRHTYALFLVQNQLTSSQFRSKSPSSNANIFFFIHFIPVIKSSKV